MLNAHGSRVTTEDTSKMMFVLFFILGTIGFLPLNFYMSANDYWMYKFRDPNVPDDTSDTVVKTDLQKDFTAYYAFVSPVCLIIFALLATFTGKRIPLQIRIMGCLSILILIFLFIEILIWINTDSWQQEFFILSLTLGGMITGAGACFLICVLELCTKLPKAYTTALLSGHSICGIISSFLQICTLLMGLSSKINAMLYFSLGSVLVLGTMVMYLVVSNNVSVIKSKLNEHKEQKITTVKINSHHVKTTFIKMTIILVIVFINTAYALVFPGLCSLIESTGKGTSKWSDVFFVQVTSFLSFHVWDFTGRLCAIRVNKVPNNGIIMGASVFRLIFIPLIILCNVQPRNNLSVVFHSDTIFIILIILYGFTTGYISNIYIMKAARICETEEWHTASLLLILVFILSLVVYSFLGSVLVNLL